MLQVITPGPRGKSFRHFLDNQQYSTTGILRYERIFGEGFVSTGGIETTKVCFCFCCMHVLNFEVSTHGTVQKSAYTQPLLATAACF